MNNDELAKVMSVHATAVLAPLLARLDAVTSEEEGRALVRSIERSADLAERADVLEYVLARADVQGWLRDDALKSAKTALLAAMDRDEYEAVRAAERRLEEVGVQLNATARTGMALRALERGHFEAWRALTRDGTAELDMVRDNFMYPRAVFGRVRNADHLSLCGAALVAAVRAPGGPSVATARALVTQLNGEALARRHFEPVVALHAVATELQKLEKAAPPPRASPEEVSQIMAAVNAPPPSHKSQDADAEQAAKRKRDVEAVQEPLRSPKKLRRQSVSADKAPKVLSDDESSSEEDSSDDSSEKDDEINNFDPIRYKGLTFRLSPATRRYSVRPRHIEAAIDAFVYDEKGKMKLQEVMEVYNKTLIPCGQKKVLSQCIMSLIARTAFGERVRSYKARGGYHIRPRT